MFKKVIILTILFSISIYASNLNKFDPYFKYYGDKYGLSYLLLKTVALTENNKLNPKAIRYNTNGTKDIGLMQINTLWIKELPKMHLSEKKLKNTKVNIKIAAIILSRLIKEKGYSWNTIGCYHSNIKKYKEPWIIRAKSEILYLAQQNKRIIIERN